MKICYGFTSKQIEEKTKRHIGCVFVELKEENSQRFETVKATAPSPQATASSSHLGDFSRIT